MSFDVHLLCNVSISRRFQRDVFSLAGIGPKCVIRNSDAIQPEQVKSTVSIIGDLQSGFQKNFSIIRDRIFQNYDFSSTFIGVALVLLNIRGGWGKLKVLRNNNRKYSGMETRVLYKFYKTL